MTIIDDLSQAPDLYDTPTTDEDRVAFKVDGIGTAIWAHRKLAEIERKRKKIRAAVSREIARLEEWADTQEQKLEPDDEFFRNLLTNYALRLRAETNGRTKSFTTPYGTVSTRETTPRWEMSDPQAALSWAKANRPDMVKVTETFALAEAKRSLSDTGAGEIVDPGTGESVPGIRVSPRRLVAKVTVDLSGSGKVE